MNIDQIPKGYKLTEAGVIPEDWKVEHLCTLAEIRTGIAKNSNIAVNNPILVHYLRVANVQDDHLDLTEINNIAVSKNDLTRYSVLPGDVLMNEGGDLDKLGRGSIWRGQLNPCVHQNHVFVVRCRQLLSPEYLNIWSSGSVSRHYFLVAGKQTTNLATINKTALGQLPIALPSLPEQIAIATALSDVDELLQSLDRLIAKKRDIKQATMQQLLTGKTRLPGFENEWEVKQLGDIADVIDPHPSHRAPAEFTNGIPFVGIGDLNENGEIIGNKIRLVNQLVLEEHLMRYNLKDELIGLGRVASIGKVVSLKEFPNSYVISPTLGLIRSNKVNRNYLLYALKSKFVAEQFLKIMSGSTRSSIGMEVLRELQINVPSTIPEQTAIAQILSDMDTEIATLEQRRDKTRALKQGMMQQLLTGRIRLKH